MIRSQCQDPRHDTPHPLPCDCCTEHCDPQEWVEIEEDQAMNTQDDTISKGELETVNVKKIVEITRAKLVDLLVDIRLDDFDSHDLDDAVRNGRYGYAELPNAELEDLADEWGLEKDGEEVRYKVTDADAKPMLEEINADLLNALKDALSVIEQDMPRVERNQKRERIIAAIAKAEGRA